MAKDYDREGLDREIERTRPSDDPQIAALGDLGDYEVAEGYPDPRGWTVTSADGVEVGKVKDLVVDTGTMRARYLAVRLSEDVRPERGSDDDRDVLIPIGTARIDDDADRVRVDGLAATRFASLPAYHQRTLTRDQENDLRSHFTPGQAASAGTIGAGAVGNTDFYEHEHYDDRSFFSRNRGADRGADRNADERITVSEEQLEVGKRQVSAGEVGIRKNVETRHVEQEVPLTREEVTVERRPLSADANVGEVRINDDEIRVPVMREEAVVEKRMVPVEEIIIRKTAVRDTETVGADLRRERVDVDESGVRARTDRIDRGDEGRRAR